MNTAKPESVALTKQIVEWRERDKLSWGQIAMKTGLSRFACQERYRKSQLPSERAQRKHAETVANAYSQELETAHKANETARALIRDLEGVVNRQRSEIDATRAELAAARTLIADLESRLGEAQQGLYVAEERQS